MNINKLWKKLLMASTLLALLFTAACAGKNEIRSKVRASDLHTGISTGISLGLGK
jgi:hypothetical protein